MKTLSNLLYRKHPGPGNWWLLLFYDVEDVLLGGAFVESNTVDGAVDEAVARGCYPGGGIMVRPLIGQGPATKWCNRLFDWDAESAVVLASIPNESGWGVSQVVALSMPEQC